MRISNIVLVFGVLIVIISCTNNSEKLCDITLLSKRDYPRKW